jgi:hypothetical protein
MREFGKILYRLHKKWIVWFWNCWLFWGWFFMKTEKEYKYCEVSGKCRNRGKDCDHCTRSFDYEESGDCFDEEFWWKQTKRITMWKEWATKTIGNENVLTVVLTLTVWINVVGKQRKEVFVSRLRNGICVIWVMRRMMEDEGCFGLLRLPRPLQFRMLWRPRKMHGKPHLHPKSRLPHTSHDWECSSKRVAGVWLLPFSMPVWKPI